MGKLYQFCFILPSIEYIKNDDTTLIEWNGFWTYQFKTFDPKKSSYFFIYAWILTLGPLQIRKCRPEGFWSEYTKYHLMDDKEA